MNLEKLIELCKKHTVEVSFNGFMPFKQNVIDADDLLEEIHTVSELSKDDFIKAINDGNFLTVELESIFKNIKSQGTFLILGYEALKNHSYIECNKLNWLK